MSGSGRGQGARRIGRLWMAGLAFWGLAGAAQAQEPSPSPSPAAAPSPSPTPSPSPSPTPSPAASPAPLRPPNVSGYMQIDERVASDEDVPPPTHEFNIRRARLTISGRVGERVAYSMMFQGDGANANTASLLEGYMEMLFRPWFRVKGGQYKYDFDIEGKESDAGTPLIDRAFVTTAVAGGLNGTSTASNPSGSFRDRGVNVGGASGTKVKLNWSLGLFQGTGRASDNNNKIAYVLDAGLEPSQGIRFNAGFLSSDNTPPGAERNTYRAWTIGGSYDRKAFFARAEYYQARRERGPAEQDLDGYYVVGSFSPTANTELLARYDTFQDELFRSGSDHMDGVTLGVKYYFDRRDRRSGTFVTVNYYFRNAAPGVTSGLTVLNDGRGAPVVNGDLVGNVLSARLQVRF